jgi:peroxiredoxin
MTTASRLQGLMAPDHFLCSTDGVFRSLARERGKVVCVVYPYTGRPGVPDPENWDNIPGAHGSTPQLLVFSKRYREFQNKQVKVLGVSLQDSPWQKEFVDRNALAFPLLSDALGKFSSALALPRFKAGTREFLTRITLILDEGIISAVRFPVDAPADDADRCLEMLSE